MHDYSMISAGILAARPDYGDNIPSLEHECGKRAPGNNRGHPFYTRLKSNAVAYPFGNRRKPDTDDVLLDQKVKFTGHQFTFRQINYVDPETGIEYQFLTNSKKIKASEVAAIYKERWQIELFLKWIKQNLKVKSFLGSSSNAVLTQLWIALCVYLLLSYFKFMARDSAGRFLRS